MASKGKKIFNMSRKCKESKKEIKPINNTRTQNLLYIKANDILVSSWSHTSSSVVYNHRIN